jgi:transposase-like protein
VGVSSSMLHRWHQRFEPELEDGTQASQGAREEIERLRSELRDVKAENTPLKKAAALFAKEVKCCARRPRREVSCRAGSITRTETAGTAVTTTSQRSSSLVRDPA